VQQKARQKNLLIAVYIMNALNEATKWMSFYCRLRDAIKWNKKFLEDITGIEPKKLLVKCCTCGKVGSWYYSMEAGHFIPKGKGGQSGVRFDERNVHAQCKGCNAFHQGQALEYQDYMLKEYGQEVIDELRKLDRIVRKRSVLELMTFAQMYKGMYQGLLDSL